MLFMRSRCLGSFAAMVAFYRFGVVFCGFTFSMAFAHYINEFERCNE